MVSLWKKLGTKGFLLCLILAFVWLPGPVFSLDLQSRLKELDKKIQQYKAGVEESRKRAQTLQEELEALERNIGVVESEIGKTEEEIVATQKEIIRLNQAIENKRRELKEQEEILDESLRFLYETGDTPLLELLLASDSLNQALDQMEYISWVEKRIEETVEKIANIKADLEHKLSQQKDKEQELNDLKNSLIAQKNNLQFQKNRKAYLLALTKGEEAKYQEYLARAREEYKKVQAQLQRLLSGNYVSQGHVKKGDIIGFEGSTGFSTGPHLHFGVYVGSQDVDPLPYLQSGRLAWPFPPGTFVIAQYYWGTFSHRGRGWPGGLDLVSYEGAPVRAAADGEIIANVRQDWGFGHFIIIDHGDIKTLYAHLK